MSNDSHKERCLQKMQRAIDDAIRLDFKLETALFEFARYKPGNWRELDDRTSQLRHSISELSNAIDVCMLLFKHKFKLLQNLELLPNNNSTQPSTQLADKIKMLRQALERFLIGAASRLTL
jgi:hypothetical protein